SSRFTVRRTIARAGWPGGRRRFERRQRQERAPLGILGERRQRDRLEVSRERSPTIRRRSVPRRLAGRAPRHAGEPATTDEPTQTTGPPRARRASPDVLVRIARKARVVDREREVADVEHPEGLGHAGRRRSRHVWFSLLPDRRAPSERDSRTTPP